MTCGAKLEHFFGVSEIFGHLSIRQVAVESNTCVRTVRLSQPWHSSRGTFCCSRGYGWTEKLNNPKSLYLYDFTIAGSLDLCQSIVGSLGLVLDNCFNHLPLRIALLALHVRSVLDSGFLKRVPWTQWYDLETPETRFISTPLIRLILFELSISSLFINDVTSPFKLNMHR